VRALHAFPIEPDALNFPFARSIIVVRSEITVTKTAKTTTESRFYLSSQLPDERTSPQWHQLIRGHWAGVEIRNHWRRDAIWGEDGSRTRRPTALANLALLRSALLALLPDPSLGLSLPALHEKFAASPAAALRLLRAK
jgi:predicted transposase YbfD/YdcC